MYQRTLESIKKRLYRAIEEKVFPGFAVGFYDEESGPAIFCGGHYTYERNREMTAGSLFDVASVTKSIPVSTLTLQLLDSERISLDSHIHKVIPELKTSWSEMITLRHLLTHTLDFGIRLSTLKDDTPETLLQKILTAQLKCKPGTTFFYSNATSIILGIFLERILKMPLYRAAEQYLFSPLGMSESTFFPLKKTAREYIVPTEIDAWRGRVVQGEIHDESAWRLAEIMQAGSAGLFSTVTDLLRFTSCMVTGGSYKHKRILSRDMVNKIPENYIASIGESAGLGWEFNQPRYMGKNSAEIFGKTGFTGCVVMINLIRRKSLVLLSNYTFPHRKKNADRINEVRRDIADLYF